MTDDILKALMLAKEGKGLPMRLPYGQRYNPETDKLDAPSSKGIGFYGPLKLLAEIILPLSIAPTGIFSILLSIKE